MIRTQDTWRNGNAAPQQLYLDTPPLKGWRSLPTGSECYRERNQYLEESAIPNGISRYRDS